MSDNPNIIIEKRLNNIENRIGRLAFLLAHLKKFKQDQALVKKTSRFLEGLYLFYYYAFSQFILEVYKLFDDDNDEYYTLPKLLNYIESNIKQVGWYKSKVEYPEPTEEQWKSGEPVWSTGKKTEWTELATGKELDERKEMIKGLKEKISQHHKDLKKIKDARDKVIAHLDKDFQKHNIRIELEMVENLFLLAHEVLNVLLQKLTGTSLYIEFVKSDAVSIVAPIIKYHQLLDRLITTKLTGEKSIPVEELNQILFSNTANKPTIHVK